MISALLSMLSDEEEKPDGELNFSMPDPAMLQKIMMVMGELSKDSDDAKLLYALKPYLKPSRQKKVDEAATLCKLIGILPKMMEEEKDEHRR